MTDDQPRAPRTLSTQAIHLVRTTQQAHYQLSQMADQKASILMGATFVIFTITIGQAKGAGPALPLLILGGFAFLSAVLAVLAILPATHYPQHGPVNLLFFGSFGRLEQEEYIDQLMDKLETDESVYRTIANDIYQNGRVLERKKYRLLGYAYRVFLVGLTASMIAFAVQYAMPHAAGAAARTGVSRAATAQHG